MVEREITGANDFCLAYHAVCMYCSHLVMAWSSNGEDSYTGCGLRKEDGKYVNIGGLYSKIDFFGGCDRFKPSGIPTHPLLV